MEEAAAAKKKAEDLVAAHDAEVKQRHEEATAVKLAKMEAEALMAADRSTQKKKIAKEKMAEAKQASEEAAAEEEVAEKEASDLAGARKEVKEEKRAADEAAAKDAAAKEDKRPNCTTSRAGVS